jgi:hypothetical protein
MGKTRRVVGDNHLNEMIFRMKYKLSESAKYHPIIDETDEFDDLPIELYNTDDGQPMPSSSSFTNEADNEVAPPIGSKTPTNTDPSTEEPMLNDLPAEVPPEGGESAVGAPISDPMNAPPTDMPDPIGTPIAPATPPVDDIQNSIIKHNLAAMEAIASQLSNLNGYVQSLDNKMKILSSDVEEVREPTNVEKLMNKTQVSYPYYFNLNDMWGKNWFNEKRESGSENERGIRELPDGTFVADFDDLPKQSNIDIEKTFNDLV